MGGLRDLQDRERDFTVPFWVGVVYYVLIPAFVVGVLWFGWSVFFGS